MIETFTDGIEEWEAPGIDVCDDVGEEVGIGGDDVGAIWRAWKSELMVGVKDVCEVDRGAYDVSTVDFEGLLAGSEGDVVGVL